MKSEPAAAVEPSDAVRPSGKDWGALVVLSIGLGLIVLDGTIVSVSLPVIIRDLHLDLTDAQWVSSLYAVVLAAILLVTGRLADRWGRRLLFVIGLCIFMVGSGFAAASDSATALIAARAIQAVGASAIMPSTLSTVNAIFRGKYRAAAFGVWGAVISGAAAVGPLAGGALTQYASWRWIFLVNIPIGIILLVVTMFTVRETRGGVEGRGADVGGALLSAIGFGALVFAVIEGPTLGWWKAIGELRVFGLTWSTDAAISIVPVMIAIAVVTLVVFWIREKRRISTNKSAILDVRLFSLPTFAWGNVTAGTVAIAEFAVLFVLPLYLVNALGLDVMEAGWILAAMALGAFFSGAMARHVAALVGSAGTVLVGLALELIGAGVIAGIISGNSSAWIIAIPLVIYGLGMGLASAQLTGMVLRDVPMDESGQGSATQSTVRQVGSALGTAVSGAALSLALVNVLPKTLGSAGVHGPEADSLAEATRSSAGGAITGVREEGSTELADALSDGFADATSISIWVAVVCLAIGLVGAARVWWVSRLQPTDIEADRDGDADAEVEAEV
ncbi:MFS transporter [Gordonia sp. (in: high G+C Gram-positive bacteria)]|uniref:MFS transporter n=1 Tax=Gordonia sp. (in: high G+C Gram-positive bacteria) TaxID=84139 RepID=UPI0016B0284E|nr:MFS transporter [Gordonia sp. (in: high G+C Gram-positive bacteria)]NLG44878.1 MFS transporter [Gordonia sp. (in: high G+C Gram-positive bacteria)]